jgi:hypothetical protein
MKLAVYFEGQFWVGVIEEQEGTRMKAVRYVFGPEPNEVEVLEFVQAKMMDLLNRSSGVLEATLCEERKINPKRQARQIAREMSMRGVSTQAQQTIQLELENRKKERKQVSRQRREEMQEMKWAIKVRKAKEKHRGR